MATGAAMEPPPAPPRPSARRKWCAHSFPFLLPAGPSSSIRCGGGCGRWVQQQVQGAEKGGGGGEGLKWGTGKEGGGGGTKKGLWRKRERGAEGAHKHTGLRTPPPVLLAWMADLPFPALPFPLPSLDLDAVFGGEGGGGGGTCCSPSMRPWSREALLAPPSPSLLSSG